jgi:nitronate monooxygenase
MSLPLIAAPMFRVSGPDLVVAACRQNVIGAFPTANCRSIAELEEWLSRITSALGPDDAPYCPNLIMRRAALKEELDCILKFRPEVVITSVGSPKPVIGPLHDIGCLVLADVASIKHAKQAVEAGADGLILLTAGAGGQTGWANGFAFVRAVRSFFDGPVVLAGGISDGQALWAAQALGCDLAYMGTKFIATRESMAAEGHKLMLVNSSLDDVMRSSAFTGLESNTLRPSVIAAGLDPNNLPTNLSEERAAELYGSGSAGPKRWRDIWSAGHSVSGVASIPSTQELVETTRAEYLRARDISVQADA